MSSDQNWRIHIRNVETFIRVGIHSHEKDPQRILVNATIDGRYPLKPVALAECFDYEKVPQLVLQEWPKRPHAWLLEGCVVELLEYIFAQDDRVQCAKVSVCKPDIFPEAESVGVETEWTRADFERAIAK